MLLNEFLKEHQKVEDLKKDFQATMAQLTAQPKSRQRKSKRSAHRLKRANLRRKWSTIPKGASHGPSRPRLLYAVVACGRA